jgi:hypothetical protein
MVRSRNRFVFSETSEAAISAFERASSAESNSGVGAGPELASAALGLDSLSTAT